MMHEMTGHALTVFMGFFAIMNPVANTPRGGAGTIAAAMNFSSAGGPAALLITIGAFALLCIITFIFFVSGERLVHLLGDNGLGVITRLMGLILAVIGTQMVITGVTGAIKLAS